MNLKEDETIHKEFLIGRKSATCTEFARHGDDNEDPSFDEISSDTLQRILSTLKVARDRSATVTVSFLSVHGLFCIQDAELESTNSAAPCGTETIQRPDSLTSSSSGTQHSDGPIYGQDSYGYKYNGSGFSRQGDLIYNGSGWGHKRAH